MAQTLFIASQNRYRIATIKEIREIYFEGISQHTFVSLFSDENMEYLKTIEFTNFRGYQNAAVVEYIIEVVGRVPVSDR